MSQQNSTLRFDHREIAVIFSLFVFVSLLMFTVGILVGKGLAQAHYDSLSKESKTAGQSQSPATVASMTMPGNNEEMPSAGTSVTTDAPESKPAAPAPEPPREVAEEKKEAAPLKLIPQKSTDDDALVDTAKSNSPEIESLLKDSRIKSLIEAPPSDDVSANRAIASVSTRKPESFPKGAYTVQVGSYTTAKDATDRVEALKKLGFPYAYFSVKPFEDKKTKWYRVWLGYFPDSITAKDSGRSLEQRGEVKNYIVRNTDSPG
jgi:hypothetical protein